MFETRGRKNRDAYVDGKLYVVKKPLKIGATERASIAVVIPKDWIESVSLGKEIKYFLLDIRDTHIILKPHFDDIPELEDEE